MGRRRKFQEPGFLNASPAPALHVVSIITHFYALVSVSGEPGFGWVSLEKAAALVSAVGNLICANSRISQRLHAHLLEAEMAVRTEWAQPLPELPLKDNRGIFAAEFNLAMR